MTPDQIVEMTERRDALIQANADGDISDDDLVVLLQHLFRDCYDD